VKIVLRRIFGFKIEELTERIKLQNGEFRTSYPSPNVVLVTIINEDEMSRVYIMHWRSRMRGTIPPLPNTPSYRGAQLKHRDNLSFLLRSKRLHISN
jgi:hypothetical protein